MSALTLDSIMEIYKTLPRPEPLPMAILAPAQARFNNILSQQIELLDIPVIRDKYLPVAIYPKPMPRRSGYRTRRGFKMARNHWRREEKRFQKVERNVVYLLKTSIAEQEDRLVSRLFGI